MKDKILDSIKSVRSKGRQGFYFEMALFLVLGFLVGVAVKTEAAKRVTIGFNDYKIVSLKQGYSFSEIQKNLAEKKKEAKENEEVNSASENGACRGLRATQILKLHSNDPNEIETHKFLINKFTCLKSLSERGNIRQAN